MSTRCNSTRLYAIRSVLCGACRVLRLGLDRLYGNQSGVNFPVADPFEPGEPLLGDLDSPIGCARRPDSDHALATAEQLLVPRDLIDEGHAISRHLSPLRRRETIAPSDRPASM